MIPKKEGKDKRRRIEGERKESKEKKPSHRTSNRIKSSRSRVHSSCWYRIGDVRRNIPRSRPRTSWIWCVNGDVGRTIDLRRIIWWRKKGTILFTLKNKKKEKQKENIEIISFHSIKKVFFERKRKRRNERKDEEMWRNKKEKEKNKEEMKKWRNEVFFFFFWKENSLE